MSNSRVRFLHHACGAWSWPIPRGRPDFEVAIGLFICLFIYIYYFCKTNTDTQSRMRARLHAMRRDKKHRSWIYTLFGGLCRSRRFWLTAAALLGAAAGAASVGCS